MKIILTTLALLASQSLFAAQTNVPKYFPDFWNEGVTQDWNNCFNYSTNRKTDSFAQPGESGGATFSLTCESVMDALTHDEGIEPTQLFAFNGKTDDTLIALVVAPEYDFHWYRRGDDGKWSHKPGSLTARNVDESDKEITDVETADRGNYTDFCGYYRVKNYIYADHEQDGGHVKIGNMKSMPEEPEEGSFTVLKYSGRRNPVYNLATVLRQHPDLAKQLLSVSANLHLAEPATDLQKQSMGKLGDGGILIRDTKGLIFPRGTRVQIWRDKVLVDQGRHSQMLTLEKAFSVPAVF
jgi:hypothetical protein